MHALEGGNCVASHPCPPKPLKFSTVAGWEPRAAPGNDARTRTLLLAHTTSGAAAWAALAAGYLKVPCLPVAATWSARCRSPDDGIGALPGAGLSGTLDAGGQSAASGCAGCSHARITLATAHTCAAPIECPSCV